MKNKSSFAPNDAFCLSPWNQIHVTPIGVVKPCCVFDGGLQNENYKTIRITDDKVENIWNGKAFKDLRLKMLKGEKIPECKKCYEEEKVSNSSDRIRYLTLNSSVIEAIMKSLHDGQVDNLPSILNLKIGNKCNLKCRMCQPLDSAMIDAEFSLLSKLDPRFRSFDNANAFDYNYNETPIEIAGNWISEPIAKENMFKLLANTEHMSLAGGEVAFTQEAIDLLKFCVDENIAKNINITASSNLTRLDEELLNLMAHFKCFRVVASIDGIENTAEYIRYPSKWNIIKKNLKKLVDAPINIVPVIAPTIQIYNVLNIVQVLELAEELDCKKWEYFENPSTHLTVLFDPQHLSIRHLPRSIKDLAIERLLEFQSRSKLLKASAHYSEQFKLLVNTLKQDNYDTVNGYTSRDYLAHFLQYTQDLDKQRNQRFQDYLPELYQLLQKENITPKYPSENPQNYTYFKFRDTGFRLYGENKISEALEMFNKAYEMYSKDTDLIFSLAMCHEKLGNKELAYKQLKEIEALKPEHFFALVQLANYHMTENNFQEAVHYFNLSIKNAGENNVDYALEKLEFCNNKIKEKIIF